MSNLRICHITSMHEWHDDRIFQRACIGLARKGFNVHLVAIGEKGEEFSFESYDVNVYLLPQVSGWKRRIFGSRSAINKAIKIDADIYHFHDPDLLPHISKLLKISPKSAVVYDIHENYAGRFLNWGLPSILGKWFRVYEKYMINQLSGITVVSESMRLLFKDVKVPIEITRNSTDLERLKHLNLDREKNEFAPLIITSGTHSHERNCLQTVQSIKYVAEKVKSMPIFQYVGKYLYDIDDEMKNQAKQDGVLDYLLLDGMMSWEHNFMRISKAFCGCVFYKDTPNNRVGIPNRLFEYMYCGIPVIVSDFPELKNIVETANCGIVVDSDSPQDIARGLCTLLKDIKKAKRMGENGFKALKENYGFHVDLIKLENFYYRIFKTSK